MKILEPVNLLQPLHQDLKLPHTWLIQQILLSSTIIFLLIVIGFNYYSLATTQLFKQHQIWQRYYVVNQKAQQKLQQFNQQQKKTIQQQQQLTAWQNQQHQQVELWLAISKLQRYQLQLISVQMIKQQITLQVSGDLANAMQLMADWQQKGTFCQLQIFAHQIVNEQRIQIEFQLCNASK